MQCPKNIPATVRNFAIINRIPLALTRMADGSDWYYSAGDDMTRTSHPKACHALALCRRYLASQVSV